jgi:hypothetical protein
MGNSSKRDTRKIVQAERANVALGLRRGGASYEQIGKHLGCRKSDAYKIVKRAIDAIPREAAEDVRLMELARLDVMMATLWPLAAKGDGAAIERMLRIMKRRAEYLGLDEPKTLLQVHTLLEKELNSFLTTLEATVDPETFRRVLAAHAAGAGGTALALTGPGTGNGHASAESELGDIRV